MSPSSQPFDDGSVKRTAKSSSALMTAPPNSPTWFSWWSSTSSTEEFCLVNSNIRAPLWPYDICGSSDSMTPITWPDCLKQTKQQDSLCWFDLFQSLQQAVEFSDVSLSFYIAASHLSESFCMDVWVGCTTCSRGSLVKKRKDWGNEHCRLCQRVLLHTLANHSHQ